MAAAQSSSPLTIPAVAGGGDSRGRTLRELLEDDWALQHSDNPEFASQAGNHAFDARLQDITPAAFQRRLEHNRALLEAMGAAAERTNPAGVDDEVVAPAHAVSAPHSDSAGGGGGGGAGIAGLATAAAEAGMSVADFAMLRQSIADETRALELGCHLFPVNSIGYGGVHYNFLEALDWLGPEDDKGARDANFVSRLEAFPEQCEQ
jgi:hypothetical protein